MYQNEDDIVAIATPPGVAALAVIRISGNNAFTITSKIVSKSTNFENTPIRFASNQIIINQEKSPIDEAIVIKYKAPKTYTGEDVVEIIAHGGVYTVNAILQEIVKNGARIAKKGEFTKRAFLNEKIDLIKAESIKEIIESTSQQQFENAINSYYGYEKKYLNTIKNKIEIQLSKIEAEIEFGEEDLKENEKVESLVIKKIIKELTNEIRISKEIKKNQKGINLSIIGPTNAGKSSLFNYLLGYKRVIVSETHGTTRDIIHEKVLIAEKEVTIHDTAGFRFSDNEIEKKGIKNTKKLVKNTDIVIWVTDAKEPITDEEKKQFENIKNLNPIVLLNKYERNIDSEKEMFYLKCQPFQISIKNKKNTIIVFEEIKKRVLKTYQNKKISHISFTERKNEILSEVINNLKEACNSWEQIEIASHYIKIALDKFEEIFGKKEKDSVINNIFENFCIGK